MFYAMKEFLQKIGLGHILTNFCIHSRFHPIFFALVDYVSRKYVKTHTGGGAILLLT